MHERVELRLLGNVRAWRNGAELTLGSARRTAVLCTLALHPGQAVSREQLVAAVWGEQPPSSATGNVYTYVSALRQVLEPARDRWAAGRLLTSGGGSYRMLLPPESIDAFRFESLRAAARCHRDEGNIAAELAAVESALRLWHGDALAGVPGPFAETQRLRLAELRLATAERYVALLAETGRSDEEIESLRALVDTPARTGLADVLRTTGGPVAHRPGRPATTAKRRGAPLPGRDAVIAGLHRAAAEAVRGHGRSILIHGSPGMGRSALLAAALRDAAPAGCRLGWAAGDELTQRIPLGMLLECVESAMADADARRRARDLFTAAVDALDGSGAEAADRAVDLIRHAAGTAPVILVADDLHWADPLTLRVWTSLGAQAARLPLLLVATARSGASRISGLSADEVVALTPLDSASASALIRAAAPEPPEPRDLRRMLDDAGGNPTYLRLLAAGEGGRSSLVAAVGTHLAPFPEHARGMLRALAFLEAGEAARPSGATVAELAAVTDGNPDDLVQMLDRASAAGVLGSAGDRWVFQHRVVARTLYEGTPAALRITLHRLFAERIAASGGPPERVATQLLAGDVPLDGSLADWLAGNVARLAEHAPDLAVSVLQRAHAQRAGDPAQQLLLTAWLARLLLARDGHAAAAAGWVSARTADPDLEGEMRWVAAVAHERRGEYAAASDIAHAALREQRIAASWRQRLRQVLDRVDPHLTGDPAWSPLAAPAGGEASVVS
ncbi:AAA family ATPase [Krasilnikovia sp. MM14-A1004]|uniref:AAA family ATPase n=1 Tax=Krasilnikovia sp. MM14-A1004 TaxID=3373541 RepID=UPI00399C5BD0